VDTEPRPVHLVDHREPRKVSTPILVVEDDPQLRAMFQLLLQGEGYLVVTAGDGLEAVRCARAMRPSLVLLDLELPLLDGQAVASQLRAAYGDALPIIIVTATGQRAEALGITPCAYLHKPFDIDSLLTLVWRCLAPAPAATPDAPPSCR
jgi:DNA-binding response OmpR family regulator